jgi:hypothetical protein
MELHKAEGKLILWSIIAIAMLMVSWWAIAFWWYFFPLEFWGPVALLYFIPVIVCLFFFARAIYIHGVTHKHSRVIVAARVLGTIGAFTALDGLRAHPFFPVMGILIPFIAIGGVSLAQARPKVGGVLMLLAGILPAIVKFVSIFFADLIFYGVDLDSDIFYEPNLDPTYPVHTILVWVFMSAHFTSSASFFLIPGGTLALVSLRKAPVAKWVTIILGIIIIPGIIWIILKLITLILTMLGWVLLPLLHCPLTLPNDLEKWCK